MEFGILGPLEVVGDGRRLPVSRPREQRVLAALLLDAGRVVPLDRLIDAVFDERPPDTAAKQVRNCVSALRQRFAVEGLLVTTPVGYTLRIGAEDLDATVFGQRLARSRQSADAGRLDEAVASARAALALWRGPALAGIGGRRIEAAAAGLNEQRLAALEECLSYELARGRGAELVAELSELVAGYPLRERPRAHLMIALYRAGRRADALESYRQCRQILVDELGLEPGPGLRDLERAILADDPGLVDATFLGEPGISGGTAPAQPEAAPKPEPEPAPPAPPAAVVPAQLPAGATVFTGRTGPLRDLDALMAGDGDRATTVVISAIAGAAGAGKTALAVHWAHRVRSRFSDGQLYLNLRGYASSPPVRPIEALALFLRALGVPAERAPVDLDEAASMYRSLLAERRVLVVLDNAASPEQVRPLLPGSPGCMVLVTSRDRLAGLVARDGAQVLTLDVLAPDEAYTLLARTIGAQRVAAEPAATKALARLCAYLPLALRIAAATLTGRPSRRIASYVKELEEGDRISALSITGDEQSAVQAAFDLSYQALAPADRLVFRRLGLPPGPDVTVDAVAALSGRTAREAAATLDRLVTAHLVDEYTEGRFTFHDLLREYAADRARSEDSPAEREAAVRRLLDWYLSRVDGAARLLYPEILRLPGVIDAPAVFATRSAALAWLDTERTNLVAAMNVAAEAGPHASAWLLADGLRGYFHLRMCAVDWLSGARAARAAAVRDREPAAEAAAELSLGDLHWRISRYPAAIEHYGRAAEAAGRAGWSLGEAAVHGNQGIVYQQSGRLDLAVDRFRRALSIAGTIGWRPGEAANLENLAEAYWEMGRLEESAEQCMRALALMSGTGSSFAKGVLLTGLGEVCHALGRFDDAVDHLAEALSLHREVGNRGGEAETIRVLAAVHRDTGRTGEALDLARAALAHAQAAGDRRYEADALNTVASVVARGDTCAGTGQAARTYWSALELAREIGNRYPEAEALIGLALTGPTGGSAVDLARGYAEEALAVARQIGYRILEGEALAALAEIERDRPDVSARYAELARVIRAETGHRPAGQIRVR